MYKPKGLSFSLEGFIGVDLFRLYGTLMVPPPPNLKGMNPLEGWFLSVDHSPCMVP